MQPLQNLWPQLVCTGSRSPRRQIGHSYLLSKGGSKYSSYPSDLGSTSTDGYLNSVAAEPSKLGANELSRGKREDCSSTRKLRLIVFSSSFWLHKKYLLTRKCGSKPKAGESHIPQWSASPLRSQPYRETLNKTSTVIGWLSCIFASLPFDLGYGHTHAQNENENSFNWEFSVQSLYRSLSQMKRNLSLSWVLFPSIKETASCTHQMIDISCFFQALFPSVSAI